MSDVAWTAIEDGVMAWVQSSSGLTARHVTWDYWKGPRPAAPLVELSIPDDRLIGEPWRIKDDAPDPAPGAEIRVRSRGHRELQLVIQVFGDTDSGNTSRPILSRIISSLDLFITSLDAAGVGVGDVGPIQMISGRKGGVLEPRSRCQVTLHVGSEVEGRTTFIERVQIKVTADLPPDTQLPDLWIPDPPP